jgi:hypothetical protein
VLDDFKLGWSDIDILCLTEKKIMQNQADELVFLRQKLLEKYPGNAYFRLFEGGFLTLDAFINNTPDLVVYWGTSGQRITDEYCFNSFSMIELVDSGKLLFGKDIRNLLKYPVNTDIIKDIIHQFESIRKYGIYSCGWMLDIARCLYTLKTGKIIAKTEAGKWALENNLVPDVDIMQKALIIRKEPLKYRSTEKEINWEPYIKRFADVLENELSKGKQV